MQRVDVHNVRRVSVRLVRHVGLLHAPRAGRGARACSVRRAARDFAARVCGALCGERVLGAP
jgi:hypothetical protein